MTLHSGWDVFCINPGKKETMHCRVCGEECEVRRNVMGPTSYVEAAATAGRGHLHDAFTCKYAEEKWHQQVRSLRLEKENTHSPSIRRIIQMDIDVVLKTRQVLVSGDHCGQEPGNANDT